MPIITPYCMFSTDRTMGLADKNKRKTNHNTGNIVGTLYGLGAFFMVTRSTKNDEIMRRLKKQNKNTMFGTRLSTEPMAAYT